MLYQNIARRLRSAPSMRLYFSRAPIASAEAQVPFEKKSHWRGLARGASGSKLI